MNPAAQTAACEPPVLGATLRTASDRHVAEAEHMPDERSLHLPQLTISGFRGIDELSIPRLGRVTLLAGKNSVGKTTVLDAVRVYAARGRYVTLQELLRDRQEITEMVDEDGDRINRIEWAALFHGRNPAESVSIAVGPEDVADHLQIQLVDDPQRDLLSDATVTKD